MYKTFGSPTFTPVSCNTLADIKKMFGHWLEALVYYRLLTALDPTIMSLKRAWEKDLNLSLTEEEWYSILRNGKKMSRELKTRLVQFKILHSLYWTSCRLYRVGLLETPVCWKCQKDNGTLVHMLWDSPKNPRLLVISSQNLRKNTWPENTPLQQALYSQGSFIIGSNIFLSLAADSRNAGKEAAGEGVEGSIYPLSYSLV